MDKMDAMFEYWADPDYVIIPERQDEIIVDWLKEQTPDTWHRVASTWNYDHKNLPLVWILNQENCDRGTAAQVFGVEGAAEWLHEQVNGVTSRYGDDHLCSVVLRNWHRYATGELKPAFSWPDDLAKLVQKAPQAGRYHDRFPRRLMPYLREYR